MVEQGIHKPLVGGSSPPAATRLRSPLAAKEVCPGVARRAKPGLSHRKSSRRTPPWQATQPRHKSKTCGKFLPRRQMPQDGVYDNLERFTFACIRRPRGGQPACRAKGYRQP